MEKYWELSWSFSAKIVIKHFRNKSPSEMFGNTVYTPLIRDMQKQPSEGVLMKRCSENMQQIYMRRLMMKYDFNKVAKH